MDRANLETIEQMILCKRPSAYQRLRTILADLPQTEHYPFLLGYLASLEDTDVLTAYNADRLKKAVKKVPTRHADQVLNYLYQNSATYHGELASAMTLSESGLTAVIKKLKECEIPLIEISREGKYKVYSLSKAGQLYVQMNAFSISKPLLETAASEFADNEEPINELSDLTVQKLMSDISDYLTLGRS